MANLRWTAQLQDTSNLSANENLGTWKPHHLETGFWNVFRLTVNWEQLSSFSSKPTKVQIELESQIEMKGEGISSAWLGPVGLNPPQSLGEVGLVHVGVCEMVGICAVILRDTAVI